MRLAIVIFFLTCLALPIYAAEDSISRSYRVARECQERILGMGIRIAKNVRRGRGRRAAEWGKAQALLVLMLTTQVASLNEGMSKEEILAKRLSALEACAGSSIRD